MSRPVFRVLAGGRAPVYWTREVTEMTGELAALERAGQWTDSLGLVPGGLVAGPLLGTCLAELTAEIFRPVESEWQTDASARPKRDGSVAWPAAGHHVGEELGTRRERQGDAWPRHPAAARTNARARPDSMERIARGTGRVGLSRKMDAAALERLAGEWAPSADSGPDRSFPALARGMARRQFDLAVSGPTTAVHGEAPDARTRVAPRRHRITALSPTGQKAANMDWRASLIGQVGRLLNDLTLAFGAPSGAYEPELARQWASEIAGQQAPAEVLVRLARQARPDRGSLDSRGRPETRPASAGRETEGHDRVSRVGDLPGRVFPTHAQKEPPAVRRADTGWSPHTGAGDILPAWEGTRGVLDVDVDAREAAISTLPPLIPSSVLELPNRRIVSAVARSDARDEIAPDEVEDELDALAAKIKRILNDEARRHGVNI